MSRLRLPASFTSSHSSYQRDNRAARAGRAGDSSHARGGVDVCEMGMWMYT